MAKGKHIISEIGSFFSKNEAGNGRVARGDGLRVFRALGPGA